MMYQIKCSDGYEIQVVGEGENGLCNVNDRNAKKVYSGTYAECKTWLDARGVHETTAGTNAADIAKLRGRV
jgi:hypothetical protein